MSGSVPGADWDPEFAAIASSDLLPRLARLAYGESYPVELRPYGATTWPLLREIADRLALPGGGTLLDLGCGEGGPGLWLAAEAGATLVGVDFSAEALRSAARTAARLADPPPHRFVAGTFTATGLPAGSVDAAVSLDALTYCPDPVPAFAEVGRVLRPGGRLVATLHEVTPAARAGAPGDGTAGTSADGAAGVADYRPLVAEAGLRLVHHAEVAGWREPTARNYALWVEHADELRTELGEDVADVLLAEAAELAPRLADRRQVLLVATNDRGNSVLP